MRAVDTACVIADLQAGSVSPAPAAEPIGAARAAAYVAGEPLV
jgi:hypothetical protein